MEKKVSIEDQKAATVHLVSYSPPGTVIGSLAVKGLQFQNTRLNMQHLSSISLFPGYESAI